MGGGECWTELDDLYRGLWWWWNVSKGKLMAQRPMLEEQDVRLHESGLMQLSNPPTKEEMARFVGMENQAFHFAALV